MKAAEIVRQLLVSGGPAKQKGLAGRLGVSQPTISRWLDGAEPEGENRDRLFEIARQAGVLPPPTVSAQRTAPKSRFFAVPVIDWVSAGRLADPASQADIQDADTLAIGDLSANGEYFALKVSGTSMNRVSPEGSIIIVNRRERALLDGRAYVFSVRGQVTYKYWRSQPPRLDPSSADPANEPIFIDRRNTLEVVGRVRRSIFDL